MENPGIDPGTSHMLSERSTTWANSPFDNIQGEFWKFDQYMRQLRPVKTQISLDILP